MTRKIRYEIDLSTLGAPEDAAGVNVRRITRADRDALADLILDAYRGTIDYEGETPAQAAEEIDSWLDDASVRLDCSMCVEADGSLLAAALLSDWEGTQIIGVVMTAADHKQRGLGRLVTRNALRALANVGSDRVVLFITKGNTPSERLFASLGAVVVPDGAAQV